MLPRINFLLFQCSVIQKIIFLFVFAIRAQNTNFRSSTFVRVPETDDREPTEGILQDRVSGVSLGECGVSCLSNDQCFSFFHNPTQERCILSSILYNSSFRVTLGFSQFFTKECIHSKAGWDYLGNRRTTKYGLECQQWDQQSPHTHTYQSLGNQENFCRNLANDKEEEAGPWCYTLNPDIRWQTCGIPLCYDFSRNCKKKANGVDYYGRTNVTKSGSPCNYWADTSQQNHTYTFLDDQFNYCRNPFGDDKKPWCYSGSTWDYCDIPMCN
ncbi:hepatocyte growth factor-like [Crassostrea angulata]|uniref:hepatocyte growth factor-like n=1 Tax=Magallana angulata TaxID=2784310 RepID=UPI0022B0A778|nr:hepatocyte growth factor-like [Crassostrea angulata]